MVNYILQAITRFHEKTEKEKERKGNCQRKEGNFSTQFDIKSLLYCKYVICLMFAEEVLSDYGGLIC